MHGKNCCRSTSILTLIYISTIDICMSQLNSLGKLNNNSSKAGTSGIDNTGIAGRKRSRGTETEGQTPDNKGYDNHHHDKYYTYVVCGMLTYIMCLRERLGGFRDDLAMIVPKTTIHTHAHTAPHARTHRTHQRTGICRRATTHTCRPFRGGVLYNCVHT